MRLLIVQYLAEKKINYTTVAEHLKCNRVRLAKQIKVGPLPPNIAHRITRVYNLDPVALCIAIDILGNHKAYFEPSFKNLTCTTQFMSRQMYGIADHMHQTSTTPFAVDQVLGSLKPEALEHFLNENFTGPLCDALRSIALSQQSKSH